MASTAQQPILGIDLGTTNSVVAVSDVVGRTQVLADGDRRKIHPSEVSFHPNGSVLVGDAARARRVIDGPNTVYSAKRLIGRTFDAPEVAETRARVPFSIVRGAHNLPLIETRAGRFAVPEISALVIDHMLRVAGTFTELERPLQTVITAPANFTDAQRAATANAGEIAGMEVVRVLSEPTAAALAYGHMRKLSRVVCVYDFGGGTFDVSFLKIEGDVFEVLGTSGDSYLGGDDLDDRIVAYVAQQFLAETHVDIRGNRDALTAVRVAAEMAKVVLSTADYAEVRVPEIAFGPGGRAIDLVVPLDRSTLEHLTQGIVDRTFPVCQEALRTAGLRPSDVADVLLVGGTTKMPLCRRRVAEFFGSEPRTDVNPDEAVAVGAAIQANALSLLFAGPGHRRRQGREVEQDRAPTPDPFDARTTMRGPAVADPDAQALARMGTVKTPTADLLPPPAQEAGRTGDGRDQEATDLSLTLDDLARLAGDTGTFTSVPTKRREGSVVDLPPPPPTPAPAAVPTVRDVTSHSLGISTVGGFCETVIARATQVPAQTLRMFTSSRDNQDRVRIRVCQGESRRIVENRLLGDLTLGGLAARPRGQTTIEVTFHINASGLLAVEARDPATGQAQQVELTVEGQQTPEQILAAQERFRALRY